MSTFFKNFWLGIFITLLVVIIFAVAHNQYDDYQTRAETTDAIHMFYSSPFKYTIEQKLLEAKPITPNIFNTLMRYDKVKRPITIRLQKGYINELGEVFIKFGQKGQMIFFKPTITNDDTDKKITWQCIGGSDNAMPDQCREGFTTD